MTRNRQYPADGSGALPALEEKCVACDGEGRAPCRQSGLRFIVEAGRCDARQGKGWIPTVDGMRLLEFLWQQPQ